MTGGFTAAYDRSPDGVWVAPGRVNVIGEHTDYNDGFVLPMALPQGVVAAAAHRCDERVRVVSRQEPGDPVEFDLDVRPGEVTGWAAYVAGVAWSLRASGVRIGGADLAVDGDVPAGAGLSSSAALECAVATALTGLAGVDLPAGELARVAQRAENDFVGMPCGVMDQMASMAATAGHLLFLDTRSLETEQVPFDPAAHGRALLVIDTRAPHRLVDGEYADRRKACEKAAAALGVGMLREIGVDDLPYVLARLTDDTLRRRVRHIVTENERVLDTVRTLRTGALDEIGPLLTASHGSMRDDYEITVPEVDTAVEAALAAGALGARMTGGGFGGCIVALIPAKATEAVLGQVRKAFADNGFNEPEGFVATPAQGAHRQPS